MEQTVSRDSPENSRSYLSRDRTTASAHPALPHTNSPCDEIDRIGPPYPAMPSARRASSNTRKEPPDRRTLQSESCGASSPDSRLLAGLPLGFLVPWLLIASC